VTASEKRDMEDQITNAQWGQISAGPANNDLSPAISIEAIDSLQVLEHHHNQYHDGWTQFRRGRENTSKQFIPNVKIAVTFYDAQNNVIVRLLPRLERDFARKEQSRFF